MVEDDGLERRPSACKADALPAELILHFVVAWDESNRRHKDFQSFALPTELPSLLKWRSRRESNPRSPA